MRKTVRYFVVCALVLLPAVSFAGERFDGKWLTTLTCPAKGNTEGYTWKREASVIGAMLGRLSGTLCYENYQVFVGTYPNDVETGNVVRNVAAHNSRVHCVVVAIPVPPVRPIVSINC